MRLPAEDRRRLRLALAGALADYAESKRAEAVEARAAGDQVRETVAAETYARSVAMLRGKGKTEAVPPTSESRGSPPRTRSARFAQSGHR